MVIAFLSMNKDARDIAFCVHAAHLLHPGISSAPTDQYHNKATHRHYLLPLSDRDSGHYQLPELSLNSWSRLLSAGVVGFWLEGKKGDFRQQRGWGKDTGFYTFNRHVTKGEIVAVSATWGMHFVSFSTEYLQIHLSLPGSSLKWAV